MAELTLVYGRYNELPSGKQPHNYGKIHHFSWENSLFLWPIFNSYVSHYQRVVPSWGESKPRGAPSSRTAYGAFPSLPKSRHKLFLSEMPMGAHRLGKIFRHLYVSNHPLWGYGVKKEITNPRIYIYIVYIYIYKYTNHTIHIHTYILYIYMCTYTYTNIHTYTYIHIIYICVHIHIQIYKYTYIYIHTYIYIYVTSQVHLTWWVPQKLNSRDTSGRIFWSRQRCLRTRPSAGRAPSPIPTWSDSTSF